MIANSESFKVKDTIIYINEGKAKDGNIVSVENGFVIVFYSRSIFHKVKFSDIKAKVTISKPKIQVDRFYGNFEVFGG